MRFRLGRATWWDVLADSKGLKHFAFIEHALLCAVDNGYESHSCPGGNEQSYLLALMKTDFLFFRPVFQWSFFVFDNYHCTRLIIAAFVN